jgi:hypothetical protein
MASGEGAGHAAGAAAAGAAAAAADPLGIKVSEVLESLQDYAKYRSGPTVASILENPNKYNLIFIAAHGAIYPEAISDPDPSLQIWAFPPLRVPKNTYLIQTGAKAAAGKLMLQANNPLIREIFTKEKINGTFNKFLGFAKEEENDRTESLLFNVPGEITANRGLSLAASDLTSHEFGGMNVDYKLGVYVLSYDTRGKASFTIDKRLTRIIINAGGTLPLGLVIEQVNNRYPPSDEKHNIIVQTSCCAPIVSGYGVRFKPSDYISVFKRLTAETHFAVDPRVLAGITPESLLAQLPAIKGFLDTRFSEQLGLSFTALSPENLARVLSILNPEELEKVIINFIISQVVSSGARSSSEGSYPSASSSSTGRPTPTSIFGTASSSPAYRAYNTGVGGDVVRFMGAEAERNAPPPPPPPPSSWTRSFVNLLKRFISARFLPGPPAPSAPPPRMANSFGPEPSHVGQPVLPYTASYSERDPANPSQLIPVPAGSNQQYHGENLINYGERRDDRNRTEAEIFPLRFAAVASGGGAGAGAGAAPSSGGGRRRVSVGVGPRAAVELASASVGALAAGVLAPASSSVNAVAEEEDDLAPVRVLNISGIFQAVTGDQPDRATSYVSKAGPGGTSGTKRVAFSAVSAASSAANAPAGHGAGAGSAGGAAAAGRRGTTQSSSSSAAGGSGAGAGKGAGMGGGYRRFQTRRRRRLTRRQHRNHQ